MVAFWLPTPETAGLAVLGLICSVVASVVFGVIGIVFLRK
jgi:hypothetical protein